MPFIPHTPEGLLVRNRHSSSSNCGDGSNTSNNSNTCRGVTAKGEPCRRTVATARTYGHDVVDIVGDVALYCWQHKDQAQHDLNTALEENNYTHGADGFMRVHAKETKTKERRKRDQRATDAPILRERTSIDTLVARLGMVDIDGNTEKKVSEPSFPVRRFHHGNPAPRRDKEEGNKNRKYDGARNYYDKRHSVSDRHSLARNHRELSDRKKSSGNRHWLSAFCLATDTDDDYFEIVRRKSNMADQARRAEMASATRNSGYARAAGQPISHHLYNFGGEVHKTHDSHIQASPDPTSYLLTFIPRSLSPKLTSDLLKELSKSISWSDDEGYIYMFKLIDSKRRTSSNTAASPLSPSGNNVCNYGDPIGNYSDKTDNMGRTSPGRRRMGNDVNNATTATTTAAPPSTSPDRNEPIILKIGRASNVHRRLNEWTRQCDYNLSLIRYYPNPSSTSSGNSFSRSSSTTPTKPIAATTHNQSQFQSPSPPQRPSQRRRSSVQRPQAQAQAVSFSRMAVNSGNNGTTDVAATTVNKVPHVHRVERLIHLELAEKQIKKNCTACGKQHREWFEVESSRVAVRAVDEVIKRWVRWSYEKEKELQQEQYRQLQQQQ